jgi:hypothetical protein
MTTTSTTSPLNGSSNGQGHHDRMVMFERAISCFCHCDYIPDYLLVVLYSNTYLCASLYTKSHKCHRLTLDFVRNILRVTGVAIFDTIYQKLLDACR